MLSYKPVHLYNKDFDISNINEENVVYIGYIGLFENEHTFKFGKSSRIIQRELREHRKTFDMFDIIYAEICNYNFPIRRLIFVLF
jgi:hypothetical protein